MSVVEFRPSNLKSSKVSRGLIPTLATSALVLAVLTMSRVSFAQNIRGSATGPKADILGYCCSGRH
jgi:hypothetical protein